MAYEFDASNKVLDVDVPLIDRDDLLIVCKEIDEDTPEEETTVFIKSGHIVVCEYLDGYGIPTDTITLIEKYLAAHFANLAYPSKTRRSIGPLSESFLLKAFDGLNSTRYGQTAVSLDPTGALQRLSDGKGKKRVLMMSIGNGIIVD